MRVLRYSVVLFLIAALASCGAIDSTLAIRGGEEFRLGENEHGGFKVSAENTGRVRVRIVSERPGGEREELATLDPGDSAESRFLAGSVAVIVNDSADTAQVAVRIVGDTGLSMGYAEISQ